MGFFQAWFRHFFFLRFPAYYSPFGLDPLVQFELDFVLKVAFWMVTVHVALSPSSHSSFKRVEELAPQSSSSCCLLPLFF